MLLKKYSPRWVNDFADIKSEIAHILHGLVYIIEHIGSTSVPLLDSKPIIDVDIIFYDQTDFEKIALRLQDSGYDHTGNQGIEDREVFKRNSQTRNDILDKVKHHLYVCTEHSKALERHILTRNFLRKHDWARLKYQQMKYEYAAMANQDRKQYAALKELHVNGFIDSIIHAEKSAVKKD